MSCLHLLNKPPSSGLLDEVRKALSPGDSLLLLEDGVYHLNRRQLGDIAADISLYFLEEDVRARGMADKLPENARLVDYAAFVGLCASHDKTASWF